MIRVSPVKLAAAVLAAAGLAAGAAGAESRPPPPARAPARVRLVAAGDADRGGWAAGTLAAARSATLSTRLSATVQAVLVDEGTRVQAGQLLVRLSDSDVRAQLASAETALATAQAQERRMKDLAAQRAATPSELEMAEAQRAQAQAQVAAARASLAYTELRAPFDGVVQARRIQAGDLVGPGQPLVEVEGAGLEVQASLSERESAGLRLGQRVRFEAGGRRGEAEVTALTPGGDPLSHRRFLRARVLPPAAGLRSGVFARVEVPGAAQAGPAGAWVPRSAVVERGDLTGVFLAEDGRATLRWIALGEPVGDRYPVRAGLRPGEAVIDAPGALRDGDAVEVTP